MPISRRLLCMSLSASLIAAGCLAPDNEAPDSGEPASDQLPATDVPTPKPPVEEPANFVEVSFHAVTQLEPFLSQNGITKRERLVVQDTQKWATLWNQIASRALPQPPLPTVDFNHERLIVVSMGQRISSGYVITIEGVQRSGGTLYVSVREVSPGNACGTMNELTQPLAAVRVPAGDEAVQFRESTGVLDCSELTP